MVICQKVRLKNINKPIERGLEMKLFTLVIATFFVVVSACAFAQTTATQPQSAPKTDIKANVQDTKTTTQTAKSVTATVKIEEKGKIAEVKLVDANNKLCPVSGKPVSGKDFVVYNGKKYGLCCPICKAEFLKDPAKYIAKLEKEEVKK